MACQPQISVDSSFQELVVFVEISDAGFKGVFFGALRLRSPSCAQVYPGPSHPTHSLDFGNYWTRIPHHRFTP